MRKTHRLLLDEYPLLVFPTLAKIIGLNESIVLQQVHYWLTKSDHYIEDRYWVYNSYPEWQKQFPFWSERTIMRIFGQLEERGLLISGLFNPNPHDRTKWYSIEYDKLQEIDPLPNGSMHGDNLSVSKVPISQDGNEQSGSMITETTQKTTHRRASRPTRNKQPEEAGALAYFRRHGLVE